MEKTFKTKTGYCHILPDKIVLTRNGVVGNISQYTVGNNMARVYVLYGIIIAAMLFIAYSEYQKNNKVLPIIELLLVGLLVYGLIRSRNNSATPVIERNSIQNIKFIQGVTGATRSRFEVYFTDNKGKTKCRLIMLPGSLTGGAEIAQQALKIMREEKLIID